MYRLQYLDLRLAYNYKLNLKLHYVAISLPERLDHTEEAQGNEGNGHNNYSTLLCIKK